MDSTAKWLINTTMDMDSDLNQLNICLYNEDIWNNVIL